MASEKAIQYPGKKSTVAWHGRLCNHIGEWVRVQGELFVGGRKPWCEPDVATYEEGE